MLMKTPPVLNFDLPRSGNSPCLRTKFHHVNLILLSLFLLRFAPPISAIRKDVSLQGKRHCRTTVLGRYFLTDDNGVMYVMHFQWTHCLVAAQEKEINSLAKGAIPFLSAVTHMSFVFLAA
ncbi:hypothetical protein CASFOL_022074 [Castilleja foliolosa]|uniref:Uncharacterized protein n=1 Tax=Castilleja foliolosa TaxID=1961234 RepID=A0ABD3D250_9LAMI